MTPLTSPALDDARGDYGDWQCEDCQSRGFACEHCVFCATPRQCDDLGRCLNDDLRDSDPSDPFPQDDRE